jgi:formate C-acetyltransferase
MQIEPLLPVPERISRLKTKLSARADRACFERARIVTRGHRETEGEPMTIRRAEALCAVFADTPTFIRDGELLVGKRAA